MQLSSGRFIVSWVLALILGILLFLGTIDRVGPYAEGTLGRALGNPIFQKMYDRAWASCLENERKERGIKGVTPIEFELTSRCSLEFDGLGNLIMIGVSLVMLFIYIAFLAIVTYIILSLMVWIIEK